MSFPPPVHTYQRGMMEAWSAASLPAAHAGKAGWKGDVTVTPAPAATETATNADATNDDDLLSPSAQLHRAMLAQKRAAEAEAAAALARAVSPPSTPVAAPAAFIATADAFPPLPSATLQHIQIMHQCAVHAAPPHAHRHGHACTRIVSSASSSSSAASASTSCCPPHARKSFWNTRCSCIFSALPDELLLFSVFPLLNAGELATLGAVCSRWRFLSTDRMLWRRLDLSQHARTVDSGVLDNLLTRVGRHLCSLKLCNNKLLDAPVLRRLGESYLSGNSSLRELHFCSLKSVDFSVISSLLSSGAGASLRELSLFGCVNIDDACVQLVRASCPRLEDLSVRGCIRITDAAFIVDEEEQQQQQQQVSPFGGEENEWASSPFSPLSPSVDSLSLSLAQLDSVEGRSSSNSVSSSASSSLSSSSSFSPAAAPRPLFASEARSEAVGSFAHLTSLNVANCKLLTLAGLSAAFRASPRLQKVNLHALNASDDLVETLSASAGPNVEVLHLSSSNPFGGNAALTLRGISSIAARMPKLSQLNLQGSSNITDACVDLLAAQCRRLEKLNLGGCSKLTDSAVRMLCGESTAANAAVSSSSSSPLPLTHLSLFQCVHLTDTSVELLAARLPGLQHLDMHSCNALTDRALDACMRRREEETEKEDFSVQLAPFADGVSAATAMTTSAVLLQQLPLPLLRHHRPSVSLDEADLLVLPVRTPSTVPAPFLLSALQSLDVGACRRITREHVEQFKRSRPEVLVTHY